MSSSSEIDIHPGLDPITLALFQNRLDYIARQMGWVMTRTARSPIFNQSHDFSCFIAAGDGRLVSQADGIPIHTGGGGFAVRAVLARALRAHAALTPPRAAQCCAWRSATLFTSRA